MSPKIAICHLNQISEQHPYRYDLKEGEQIVIFQTNYGYYALENRCPHAGAYLHEAIIEGKVLICHWHGWSFDLESGQCLNEYWAKVKTYQVVLEQNEIYIIADQPNTP